jgi:hypothetical protein
MKQVTVVCIGQSSSRLQSAAELILANLFADTTITT